MINIIRHCLLVTLMILSHDSFAQTSGLGIKDANKNLKIAVNDIVGNWCTDDSAQSMICFINDNSYFVHIDGIQHGVGKYYFNIAKDSISVNGTAANWPPYDCTITMINTNLLQIEFYQFFSKETTKVIYKRD